MHERRHANRRDSGNCGKYKCRGNVFELFAV